MNKVPADLQYNGRGPLLSARWVDLELLWRRAQQLGTVSKEVRRRTLHLLRALFVVGLY